MSLSDSHRAIVRCVYDALFEHGRPPMIEEMATRLGESGANTRRVLAEMKVGKTVLRHPATGEIWMAGPFAAAPTDYAVTNGTVTWWANCAWDMLGVAALVDQPVQLQARCTDCGESFASSLDPANVELPDWIVHFVVPARHWYDDVGFT